MTITRKIQGAEMTFELTQEELYKAYYEQQDSFDREDVLNAFWYDSEEYVQEEFGVSKHDLEEIVDDIAGEMRRNIDKYDMTMEHARSEAIWSCIQTILNKKDAKA